MAQQLSAQELLERYPEPEQQQRLLQLYALSRILNDCIIEGSYRVPDGLHTPLVFTKYGDRVAERLRKHGVPFPESRLFCLLDMLGPEPLLDLERTDLDALQRSIHNQVKSLDFRFPLVFGRLLYDKFSGSHAEEKLSLSAKESSEFLAGTPQGVFQTQEFVVGPFGLLRSVELRNIPPTLSVPLQHCADPACGTVHKISLSTNFNAEINEHRSKVGKIFERDGLSVDEWWKFFDSIGTRFSRIAQSSGEPLITLIGDSLTDRELRELLCWLLDNSGKDLRSTAASVGKTGKSSTIVAGLDRAELLQLVCLASNDKLVAGLDALVSEKTINAPDGEIRRAVVNDGVTYGPYGMIAELNQLGVRLRATRSSIAPLRMRQLVKKMYNLDSEGDRAELSWQLRARADETIETRLARQLQVENPRDTLSKLVLARRSNAVVASEYLNFTLGDEIADDRTLIDTVLWKLGFQIDDFADKNGELFDLHERLLILIKQISPGSFDALLEDLRGLSSNYFVKLEEVLRDSLSYTTWALTSDHYGSTEPFVYREDRDGVPALLSLNNASEGESGEHRVEYTEKPGLYALCRGYQQLASVLSGLQENETGRRRPEDDLPNWRDEEQSLQVFPFDHTVAFLDLALDSQSHILVTLREASRSVVGAEVHDLRNRIMHPRFSVQDLEPLRASLMAVRETFEHLEAGGFSRQTFTLAAYEGDATERQAITLSHPRAYAYKLHRPSGYAWLRMPPPTAPQYIMQSARIKGSDEVLRFRPRVYSLFAEMYNNYPVRPRGSARVQNGSPTHSEVYS